MVHNELIDKAFKLGFESYFGLMTGVNPKCYHLWMADLQRWLRDKGIHINIKHRPHSQTFCYDITGSYYDGEDGVLSSRLFHKYKTYEEALEDGLTEALRLM